MDRILRVTLAVSIVAVAVPAASLARPGAATCHASFTHVPGIAVKSVPFKVTALLGGKPTAAARGCMRGRAVIQAGFTRFGKKAISYRNVGKLKVAVGGSTYTFVLPTPVASGSYAWSGGGTVVQYSLPTGG